MKRLFISKFTEFQFEKGIVVTSREWWFEVKVIPDKKNKSVMVYHQFLYPKQLYGVKYPDGNLIKFPDDFKVRKEDWIQLKTDEPVRKSPDDIMYEIARNNNQNDSSKQTSTATGI